MTQCLPLPYPNPNSARTFLVNFNPTSRCASRKYALISSSLNGLAADTATHPARAKIRRRPDPLQLTQQLIRHRRNLEPDFTGVLVKERKHLAAHLTYRIVPHCRTSVALRRARMNASNDSRHMMGR